MFKMFRPLLSIFLRWFQMKTLTSLFSINELIDCYFELRLLNFAEDVFYIA